MQKNNRREFIKLAGLTSTSLLCSSSVFAENLSLKILQNNEVIKPLALKRGDTIGITAPANGVFRKNAVSNFKYRIEKLGFKVVLGKTLYESYGNLAGTDELRATEFMNFISDKNINGIIAMRGGWGCARILPLLDFEKIKQNPKAIVGFSDITTLLLAIYAKTGMITYHGPVGYKYWNSFTTSSFKKILMEESNNLLLSNPSSEKFRIKTITPGKAKGKLVGGNLTVVSSLVGSGYLPDWEGKILFVEDVGEEPYSIDRMLTQLKLAGILEKISGFIFGQCAACLPPIQSQSFTLLEVVKQNIEPLNIPAYFGASIGHITNKLTFPIGINAELDADKGSVTLLENASS